MMKPTALSGLATPAAIRVEAPVLDIFVPQILISLYLLQRTDISALFDRFLTPKQKQYPSF
jgi:hypothetical protein